MKGKIQLGFCQEPNGSLYRELLKAATGTCDRLILVKRPKIGLNDNAKRVLSLLDSHLMSSAQTSEWPGTKLLGSVATVFEFRFDLQVAEVLASEANGLYDWQQPNLPEDPCLKKAGHPWLTTIAHENDAFLTIEESDMRKLFSAVPSLHRITVPETLANDGK